MFNSFFVCLPGRVRPPQRIQRSIEVFACFWSTWIHWISRHLCQETETDVFLLGGFNRLSHQPLWKMMEWKSVGMMKFPIYVRKNKKCSKAPTRFDASQWRSAPKFCRHLWPTELASDDLTWLWNMWIYLGLSENVVYPYSQWFCWSLSLLNGYFIGTIPYFQTYPPMKPWVFFHVRKNQEDTPKNKRGLNPDR